MIGWMRTFTLVGAALAIPVAGVTAFGAAGIAYAAPIRPPPTGEICGCEEGSYVCRDERTDEITGWYWYGDVCDGNPWIYEYLP